jgi:hypothetical protein
VDEPPTSFAEYIRHTIDWRPERDFDIDLAPIIARFPDLTEGDLERALIVVAADFDGMGSGQPIRPCWIKPTRSTT